MVPQETAADLEDRAKKASAGLKADAKKASSWAKSRAERGEDKLQDPKVQAGLATVVNLLALGGVGLLAYKNWGKDRWDRRVVSATVIGLGALFGSQGYLGWLFYGKK